MVDFDENFELVEEVVNFLVEIGNDFVDPFFTTNVLIFADVINGVVLVVDLDLGLVVVASAELDLGVDFDTDLEVVDFDIVVFEVLIVVGFFVVEDVTLFSVVDFAVVVVSLLSPSAAEFASICPICWTNLLKLCLSGVEDDEEGSDFGLLVVVVVVDLAVVNMMPNLAASASFGVTPGGPMAGLPTPGLPTRS